MRETDTEQEMKQEMKQEKETEQKTEAGKEKTKKKGGRRILLFLLLFCLLWWAWSWVPFTERMEIKLPAVEAGVRIVLVTDLHSCYYGKDQRSLLERIAREEPDLVLMSGDIFDDELDGENTWRGVEKLAQEYPCCYVSGNHEFWSGRMAEIKERLREMGVYVLDGECETFTIKGTDIDICGVDDPTDIGGSVWKEQLKNAYAGTQEGHVKILLSHRPEMISSYEQYDFDLVLSGHAHGGQILVPFLNKGLLAPNQGLFAQYVNGAYELSNGSLLVVSRGLARESMPLPRYFNHPELLVLELSDL